MIKQFEFETKSGKRRLENSRKKKIQKKRF